MRILVAFLFLFLTRISVGQTNAYVSAKSGISLREKPSTNGTVITKLTYGEKITITEQDSTQVIIEGFSGNWLKIQAISFRFIHFHFRRQKPAQQVSKAISNR